MATRNVAKTKKMYESLPTLEPDLKYHLQQMDIVSSGMNNLRANGSSCDVFIISGNKKFPAHRIVLRAGSDFFDAMFSSGLKEASSSEISLPTISEKSTAIILDFFYLQQLNLDILLVEEILDLLSCAHFLQVFPVIEMCVRKLSKMISVDNWFVMFQHAVAYSINYLISATVQFLSQQKNLIDDDQLQKLEFDTFNILITSLCNGSCTSADVLLNLIVNWVAYKADREKHLVGLLSTIDISSVSKDVLTNLISDNSLIKKSLELSHLLLTKITAGFNDSLTVKTASSNPKLLIFNTNHIKSFDLLKRKWFTHNLPGNILPGENSSLTVADHGVYFTVPVKGEFGSTSMRVMTIIAFYPAINSTRVISTCRRRREFKMIYLNNALYMTGGYVCTNGTFKNVSYLRCLCLRLRTWQCLAKPILHRVDPYLVAACGKIYVFGGRKNEKLVRDVERYCPETNQWSSFSVVPDPNLNYYDFAIVSYFSKIYLAINTETDDTLNHTILLEFIPESNSWQEVTKEFVSEFESPMNSWLLHGSSKPLPFLVIEQDKKYYKMDPRTLHCTLITEKENCNGEKGNLVVFA